MHKLITQYVVLLMALLCFTNRALAQDPNFHIYLCFGQSNMEGHGPIEAQDLTPSVDPRFQVMGTVNCSNAANTYTLGKWQTAKPPIFRCETGLGPTDYFGRTMVANLPSNIKVGVVPVAVGGCDIALFDKVNYASYVATVPSWMAAYINEYGGNPYARLVQAAKLAQKDGVIKGILFHQGETNSGQTTWPAKVKAVYDNLISDLGLDPTQTPFLVGELVTSAEGGVCGGHNSIIATLPKIIPNAHVISAAGLPCESDGLHFTSASYRIFGPRYAQMMLSLLPPTCATPLPAVSAATITYGIGEAPKPLTATGTALKWYTAASGGTASSTAPTPNTNTAGSFTYYVSQTANGCESPRTKITVNVVNYLIIPQALNPPDIDGKISEAAWLNNGAAKQNLSKTIVGTAPNATDLSGYFQATWDATNLYIAGTITDNVQVNENCASLYNDDAIEVFIDMGNTKSSIYGANDFQYTFRWSDPSTINTNILAGSNNASTSVAGISFVFSTSNTAAAGYTFEAAIPWKTLGGNPAINQIIGFDFQVDDDDAGGCVRKSKMSWNASADQAFMDPSYFGTAKLGASTITGIADAFEIQASQIMSYPNPFSSEISLQYPGAFSYSISDLLGNELIKGTANDKVSTGSSLLSGVYLVKISQNGAAKFIKVSKE